MKLRIAKKIIKAVRTPDQARYSDFQIGKAEARMARTKSAKETERYWHWLMKTLGPEGRADVLKRKAPGLAFGLLMREDW